MPKPLAVLNIEDSESDSKLIARLLKKAGYKITFERVETADQMRAALKKRAWDIIISDHSLPQFDSYAALAVLHEEGLDIPFITVSGIIGEETAVAMLKAGAHDYLMKDNLTRLIPAVERELEYARARRERKQAENELHTGEKRFRALIENSLDDISLLNVDGTLIWESPSVIRNLNYIPNEFLGHNIFELMHPAELEQNQKLFAELIQKPASRQPGIFRLKRSDGTWRWVEAIATNLLDEPAVQAVVVNYHDITERKRAEEALQHRINELITISLAANKLQRLASVQSLAHEIIGVLGDMLNFTYCAVLLVEETSGNLIPFAVSTIKNDPDLYETDITYILSNQPRVGKGITGWAAQHGESVCLGDVQADPRYFSIRQDIHSELCVPLRAADRIIGVVNVESIQPNAYTEFDQRVLETIAAQIAIAIQNSRLYEKAQKEIAERKQAEEALLANESTLQGILQSTADGILAVNVENEVLYANDRFALMWKIPQEIISKRDDSILLQYVLDQLINPQDFLNKVQELYQSRQESFDILYFKDGRIFERLSKPIMKGEFLAGRVWSFRDITERKQVEQKLRETEERFHELADNIDEVFWITEPLSKKDIYISPAYEKVWGRTLKDVDDFVESIQPEDRPIVVTALEKQKRGEKTEIEYRIKHKDDSVHWVWDRAFPIFDASGELKSVAGIATDITERKQAEDALNKTRSDYQRLFDHANDVILIFEPEEEIILEVNAAACAIYGFSRDELIGMSLKKLTLDVTRGEAQIMDTLENRSYRDFESIHINKNGQEIYFLINASVIEYQGKESILSINHNISERKRSEEAMRESEERFRSLFNRMLDGVYRSKHEGKFVDVNPAMVKMFGYSSREEMLAVDIKNELYFEPEERGSHVLDTGQEEMDVYRMRRKDGSEIWVEDHGSYIHDEQGRILYHEGILRDVTERKRADQALAESEARFRQAIAAADAIPYSLHYVPRHYTFIGEGIKKLAGYSFEEMTPSLLDTLILESNMLGGFKGMPVAEAARLVREGKSRVLWQCEHRIRTRSGEERWLVDSSIQVLGADGLPTGSIGIFQDITERKLAEQVIHDSEVRYHSLFEDSPVSLWEEDFSAVKLRLDALRDEGIEDFQAYFALHPQAVRECLSLVKVVDVNKATLRLFGAKAKADLLQNLSLFIDNDSTQSFQNELISIAQGKSHFEWEGVNQTLDGRQIVIRLNFSAMPGYEDTFSKVIISMVDITAHIHAEKAIRESEKSLRESQTIAGLGSYVLDVPSEKWISSDILNQIFGIDESSYTHSVENWIGLIHPDWRQEMSGYFANEVLGKHSTFDKEYKIVRQNDGAERWVHGLGKLELNAQNQPVKMRGTIQDITERKQAQEVITQQAVEYETMLSTITEGFWLVDQQGRLLEVNDAYCSMSGYSKEELLQFAIQDIETVESLEETARRIRTIMEAGTDRFESKHRAKDGRVFDVEISVAFWHERKQFFVFIQDVTERKQAEDDLRRAEEKYRDIFENSLDGIFQSTPAGRFITVNPALARMWGYDSPEDLLASVTDIANQIYINPGVRTEHMRLLKEQGGNLSGFEYQARRKDGGVIWVSESVRTIQGTDGALLYYEGAVEDISTRKQAGAALQQRARELQMLYETSLDINSRASLDTLLTSIVERAASLLDTSSGGLYLMEPHGQSLKLMVGCNLPKEHIGVELRLGEGLSGRVAQSGKPINLEDYQAWPGRADVYKNSLFRCVLAVPLKVEDKVIGVINVSDFVRTGLFSEDQVRLVSLFADQAALAIDRARLYQNAQLELSERKQAEESLRKSEQRYRALFEEMPVAIWEEDFSAVKRHLDSLKEQGVTDFHEYFAFHPEVAIKWANEVRILDVNNTAVKMFQAENKEQLIASTDQDLSEGELEHANEFLMSITDGRTSHSWEGVDQTLKGEPIEISLSWSVAPGHETDFSKVIVTTVDITERKQAEENLRLRVAELELLYESGLAISQLLNPKEIGQKIIDLLEQKMNWHHTAIRLYNAVDETLELLAFHQPGIKSDAERLAVEARFKSMVSRSGQGLSGWVVQHGQTVRTGSLINDDRYVETFADLHSGLYVPIKSGERTIGVISIESEKENAFSKSDERLATILATQAASIFENARLYEDTIQRAAELEQRVTERTTQIEAAKRRLELATHAGQIGVWEYNPRENKVLWDERMYLIHRIPAGGFDGTSQAWTQLIHPDDLEKSQINEQLAFTKNLLLNDEHRILWPDGSVRHILASAVMAYSPDGIPERIIGINMDITERKQIEQSLRESEAYARLLFDAVPDPVSVTEADGSIVDVNKVFEKQYGLARDEIRGRHISELGIYPESELDKMDNYLSNILQGQPANPVELGFNAPGDRVHTFELHSYLLGVKDRRLMLNTSHDITAYKEAEKIQRLAKSEIERALRVKNEFLANMSHELRTPLNSILGISESLEEQIAGALNEKQLKYIRIVRESGRHLLELINDILDLSKIEAGRMELDIRHISVEKFCQSSLRMVKELAQKKSLNVSYKVNGDVRIILGDERRLKQSLVNLLGNAVKFTPPGNRIGLEVNAHPETNEVTFTVWDQGVGIAQQDIQHLFKPFVQLDAGLTREYQGTGLGLALVAQMVNLHGGRISVESEIGQGSRFIITLPWSLNEQASKARVTAELSLPGPISNQKRNGRILLVEDTDVVVQLISEFLQYKGYEMILAHNGLEGVQMAAQERPDLILMDVMMPIMDGLEATQNIRKDKTLQGIPIIALTALAMSGDSERCLAAGMNDYLSKPLHMQDLADMIEKYLRPGWEESNEQ